MLRGNEPVSLAVGPSEQAEDKGVDAVGDVLDPQLQKQFQRSEEWNAVEEVGRAEDVDQSRFVASAGIRATKVPLRLGGDGVEHQRALARAGDAGEHRQPALRDLDGDVFQVVLAARPARGSDRGCPRRAMGATRCPFSWPSVFASGRVRPQRTAFLTSAAIFFSSAGVNSSSAKEVGHILPSSRFAASWKPNVEYLDLY
jgi:hypothetical protein